MQKLLARPVVAPFFLIFGLVLSPFGYTYLQRGSFQYTPQHGPTQIISPASNPMLYWTLSAGILVIGVLCLLVSAYAGLCLFRVYRADGAKQFRPPAFGILMFTLGLTGIIIASLLYTCSQR